MSIVSWIELGVIGGFIGSNLVSDTEEERLLDIVLGIVDALIAGWLFNLIGMGRMTGLNIHGPLAAVVSGVVVSLAYHEIHHRA